MWARRWVRKVNDLGCLPIGSKPSLSSGRLVAALVVHSCQLSVEIHTLLTQLC